MLPFLVVTILVVVGGGMQPREQRSQDGGGNGSGSGGRIIVNLGAVVVVCLFVVVGIFPVKMAYVGKPGRLVFGRCQLLCSCLRLGHAPTAVPPPAQRRRHHQMRCHCPRPRLFCPSLS